MLYVIGDLHLSFGSDKPMDVFGEGWQDHIPRLIKGFAKLTEEDTCVICGDLTWGISLEDCVEDFRFIDELPGRKIILKGNHDYWWSTASKAMAFFEKNGINTIEILNNNSFMRCGIAVCGTRGWFCDPQKATAHDKKIMARELIRLETSLKSAGDAERKHVFLHYPPRFGSYVCREMTDMLSYYSVEACWYGHIHGNGRRLAVTGSVGGVEYRLISADHIGFEPAAVV